MVELEQGSTLPSEDRLWLRRQVRRWFAVHGRAFPWREATDPYVVLIAELLLQRTRADLVPEVFARFVERYPTAAALARADAAEVVECLRPLGFVHRSVRLPATAQAICERFGGKVPADVDSLMSLPGVGRYVANAVAVVAFSRPFPLLDPNVLRVLARCFDLHSNRPRPRDDRVLWQVVADLVPAHNPRPVALGLIDLGAVVCRTRLPRCSVCPLRARCRAFKEGRVEPAA